ncbi:hypothetical protein FOZ61_010405 [Perkinsus olseni]|uniref:Uncharacterized protein n=1 Tax=Perkinsus olseni TaxID=32597 RepID=A0A7J6L045_PEROL|nr:hypothetical protein FOZ61_010405 [Perkinsus olseni]KAF4652963.1 hypothetical protein FOL46_009418 [Perkinsus olseni]
MSFFIGINIPFIYVVIAVYGDTFSGNYTVANPGRIAEPRSRRLTGPDEEPPNCLPSAEDFWGQYHCWHNVQDKTNVHASSSSLALYPVISGAHVGVRVEGFTTIRLSLDFGIKLYLLLNVPKFAKVGGKDVGEIKQIEFPTSLFTIMDVPCWGTVAASVEKLTNAGVHKTDKYSRLQISLPTTGKKGDLSWSITLYVDIERDVYGDWGFDGIVSARISASTPTPKSKSPSDDVARRATSGDARCPPITYNHDVSLYYGQG